MARISEMLKRAPQVVSRVQQKFDDVMSLDGNELVDKDDRPGHVSVAQDNWEATASVDQLGRPESLNFQSENAVSYKRWDSDPDFETEQLEIKRPEGSDTTVFSESYVRAPARGQGPDFSEAIVETASGLLVDFREYD